MVFALVLGSGAWAANSQSSDAGDARTVEEQERALMVGLALGLESITSGRTLSELYKRSGHPLLNEKSGRISYIFIVDDEGRIVDSSDPKHAPVKESTSIKYHKLSEVPLPPIIGNHDSPRNAQAPVNTKTITRPTEPRALSLEVKTTTGQLWVIVALR